MEFPYTEVTEYIGYKKVRRVVPWVAVTIFNPSNPDKTVTPLGLADTGVDITMVEREVGEYLDYNIESGIYDEIRGLGGGKIKGYYHKAGLIMTNPERWKDKIKYFDNIFFSKKPFPTTTPQQTAIF